MSDMGGFFPRRQQNPPGLFPCRQVGEEGGSLNLTPDLGERRVITIDTETAADGTLHVHGITIVINPA
jgi:hypothetical protein